MPTTYAVASAKGGVGKTTTAANLAATLAAAGFETVAVDGDIGTANLAPALGVDVPPEGATLHDVLAGEADPVDATYRGPHDLAVMPGDESLSAFRTADPSRIREVLGSITNADYVVVDTGAGLTHESALPLSLADEVLLVATPTRDALVDTAKTLQLTERLGGTVAGVALNRVGPDDDLESALAATDLDPDEFDVPVLGRVPEDDTVAAATAARRPLSEFAPGRDGAAAFRSLASSLTGKPIRPPLSYEVEEGEQEPATPDAGAAVDDADADAAAADAAADEGADTDAGGEMDDAVTPDDGVERDDAGAGDDETETLHDGAVADDAGAVDDSAEDAVEGATEDSVGPVEDSGDTVVEPDDAVDDPDDAVGDEADERTDAVDEAGEESDDAGEDLDDAVIIEGEPDGEEDEAAATARRTVLDDEEYQAFGEDGAVAVEDAESGEPVEIDEDAIPFANQGGERDADDGEDAEGAAEAADGTEESDEKGGILSRLFR